MTRPMVQPTPNADDGGGIIIIIRSMAANPRLTTEERARLSLIATHFNQGLGYFDRRFTRKCFGKLLTAL